MIQSGHSMNSHYVPIDISNSPDLLRVAKEVQVSKTPRVLKQRNEAVAILMPAEAALLTNGRHAQTHGDYTKLRKIAGSWQQVDTDTLLHDIYADRKRSNPPLIMI